MFLNAKIKGLEIRYNNFRGVTFEESVFEGIGNLLEILQLQNCIGSSSDLAKITGSKATPLSVTLLDLQDNDTHVLGADTLSSVPRLKSLFLSRSKISAIESGIFSNQAGLQQLYLSDNILKTLPEGIFDDFTGQNVIHIEPNQWNCICDFAWFKDFYESHKTLFFDNFLCSTPWNGDYLQRPFCPDNQTTDQTTGAADATDIPPTRTEIPPTTSDISPTTTEIPPTTELPPGTTIISTSNPTELSTKRPSNGTSTSSAEGSSITTTSTTTTTTTTTTTATAPEPTNNSTLSLICSTGDTVFEERKMSSYPYTISVRNATIRLHLHKKKEDSYELLIDGDLSEDVILWFNSNDVTQMDCRSIVNNTVSLDGLKNGESYTFCIVNKESETVSPFDCAGFTIPEKIEDQSWIPNKMKSVVICSICGGILAAIVISSLVMYLCIRLHPQLIEGNDRVVILGKQPKTTDAVAAPKSYEEINYIPPSFDSNSGGYLTPVNPNYDQVRSISRNSRKRTIAENVPEAVSSTSRPVRVVNTIKRGNCSSRISGSSRVHVERIAHAFEEHVYEPPPLPPNHPSDWIYSTSTGSYSRV